MWSPGELAPIGNFFEWDGSYAKPTFDSKGVLLTDIDEHFYLYDSPETLHDNYDK